LLVKPEPFPTGAPMGRLPPYINIRLGRKYLPGLNIVAYFTTV